MYCNCCFLLPVFITGHPVRCKMLTPSEDTNIDQNNKAVLEVYMISFVGITIFLQLLNKTLWNP